MFACLFQRTQPKRHCNISCLLLAIIVYTRQCRHPCAISVMLLLYWHCLHSMKRYSVRLSICLCPICLLQSTATGLLLRARRPGDRLLQQWHENAGSVIVSVTHTHKHTRLTAIFPELPRWAGTRKAKPIWILLKQETVSGSGISWNIYKSALRSRQTSMPAPHNSVFYRPDALPAAQPTASKHFFICL